MASFSLSTERKSRSSIAAAQRFSADPPPLDEEHLPIKSDIAVVRFSKENQEILKITVGTHLTIDRPWKTIAKDALLKVLEHKEPRIVKKMKTYKHDEVLVGYQVSLEGSEGHLICLTDKGREKVLGELSLLHNNLADKVKQYLNRSPMKSIKPQRPTSRETKPERPPITYEWVGLRDKRPRRVSFGSQRQDDSPMVNRILCRNKDDITLVESAVQHAQILATPEFHDASIQTEPEITINDCTQFVPETDLPQFTGLTPESAAKLAEVCRTYKDTVMESAGYNSLFDLYKDDYSELLGMGTPLSIAKASHYKHYMSYNDISQFEGKALTALSWHPDESGAVAVSYGTMCANKMVRLESDSEDENYRARESLDVWAESRKITTIRDKDTSERNSWLRSIKRIEQYIGQEYNESQWAAAEVTLDTIEAAMNIRDYQVHSQKLKDEAIPDYDADLEEYDIYYIPYGTGMEVNTPLMKSMIINSSDL